MRRREFTLRRSQNGEVRVVPMAPAGHQVLGELSNERRLDTNRVFLYNDKPIQRIGTALRRPALEQESRSYGYMISAYGQHKSETGRCGYGDRYEVVDAAKLHTFRANTAITPDSLSVGSSIMSVRSNEVSGRSSVVES